MRVLSACFLFMVLLCCTSVTTYGQVRIRRGIHLPKFRHKDKGHTAATNMKSAPITVTMGSAGKYKDQENALDEHFYVKWHKDAGLAYNDFKYNRNLYNKFIAEQDTDLINTVYPDYREFYNKLNKRYGQALYTGNTEQDERIEHMLRSKTDSIEKGFIATATLNVDPELTINIDSPAASVLTLTPVIYALNETTYYFNIIPVFNKSESWMIVKSADILQHEQIHFDIFELYARKMRKTLLETLTKNYNPNMVHDMSMEITPAYELLYKELNQMQLEFDHQTGEMTLANQSLNNTNNAWNKQLKIQLDLLNAYAMPEGTITIK